MSSLGTLRCCTIIISENDFLFSLPVCKEMADKDGVYFINLTPINRLPLFHFCNGYDVVYKWFDYLTAAGRSITGYVMMPNDVPALIAFTNTVTTINTIVVNGKRLMAYEPVKRLGKGRKTWVSDQLQIIAYLIFLFVL